MKFKTLEIQNFGTVGKITLNLANRGLVLITGQNNDTPAADSNGAGKSLLLEAFCWSVWGATIRDLETADEVVNRIAKKDCKVSILFEEGSSTYKIVRYRLSTESRKPNDVEVYLNDEDISGPSNKVTQEIINSIIGMSFGTFCALMPGAGVPVAKMTDTTIKELLENMLDITALAQAKKATTKRLDENTREWAKTQTESAQLTKEQIQLEQQVQEYQQVLDVFESNQKKKLDAIEDQIVAKRARLLILEVLCEQTTVIDPEPIRRQISSVTDKLTRVYDNIESNRGKLGLLNRQLKDITKIGSTCSVCKQAVSGDHINSCASKTEEEIAVVAKEIETQTPVKQSLYATQQLLQESLQQALQQQAEYTRYSFEQIQLRAALAQLDKDKQAVQADEPMYSQWIASHLDKLRVIKAALSASEEKAATHKELDAQLQFWKKGFSTQGIRSYLLDNIIPVLNERADYYATILTGDEMSVRFSTKSELADGSTKEKFSIRVEQRHGGSSYGSNSEGEKSRANLAIALAISDLASLHSHKSIDFRFCDEVFDKLDQAGQAAVMKLLQVLKDKYPTVMVVTHQDSFKELFQNTIQVTKYNGISTLEEV